MALRVAGLHGMHYAAVRSDRNDLWLGYSAQRGMLWPASGPEWDLYAVRRAQGYTTVGGAAMNPDVDHTPAGGSPPRPVPQMDDWIKVVKLPDEHDAKLRLGQRGIVVVKKEAMYCVRFGWGLHWLTVMQIELVG